MRTKGKEQQHDLVHLTNIPTPYRLHFYFALHQLLRNRTKKQLVCFGALTEPGRFWSFETQDWRFEFEIGGKSPIVVWGYPIYCNLSLLSRIVRQEPKRILVSGGWFQPTNQLLLWLFRLKKSNTKIYFWTESNLQWVQHKKGVIAFWRKITFRLFDGFVVPGQRAKEYLLYFYPEAAEKSIIELPNLVNEKVYSEDVAFKRKQNHHIFHNSTVNKKQRILFMVSRLAPIKGVMELLQAVALLDKSIQEDLLLIIAGDGKQKEEISSYISNHNLLNVQLLGHIDEDQMVTNYANADGFILPSLGDPYPLAVIEAAFAGLPLLLSDRVGCHPEALVPNENGWLFDPYQIESIQNALIKFLTVGIERLHEMGANSSRIAHNRFHTDVVLPRFVDQLLT